MILLDHVLLKDLKVALDDLLQADEEVVAGIGDEVLVKLYLGFGVAAQEKADAEEDSLHLDVSLYLSVLYQVTEDVHESEIAEEVLAPDDVLLIEGPLVGLPFIARNVILANFLLLVLQLDQSTQYLQPNLH